MNRLIPGIQCDVKGQLSHLIHKMPNTRHSSRRNGGEIPTCHGYADWRSFRETQIACLVHDNGKNIGLTQDCVGFLLDLLVGLEEL